MVQSCAFAVPGISEHHDIQGLHLSLTAVQFAKLVICRHKELIGNIHFIISSCHKRRFIKFTLQSQEQLLFLALWKLATDVEGCSDFKRFFFFFLKDEKKKKKKNILFELKNLLLVYNDL